MLSFKFRREYLVLLAIGMVWGATMFVRGLVDMHPWQPEWVMWVLAHDFIAACFGYQVGQVAMLGRGSRKPPPQFAAPVPIPSLTCIVW